MADFYNILDFPPYAPWDADNGQLRSVAVEFNTVVGDEDTGKNISSLNSRNTLIGASAGEDLTIGDWNVAVGSDAMERGITNSRNVAVGQGAGEGRSGNSYNDCVYVGFNAAYLPYSGANENVSIGSYSMYDLTTGYDNVVVGYRAAPDITSGHNNVIIGEQTATGLKSGFHNISVGTSAGPSGSSTSKSTFFGYKAGNNTSGSNNTFIGYLNGEGITSGTDNILIGPNVGQTVLPATADSMLVIGSGDVNENTAIIYGEMDNDILKLNADVRITEPGVETADPEGQLDVIQTSTTGAQPVLVLDQDDISEEFIKLYGSAASGNLTQSFVDVGDVTTATLKGYLKINVQDEGNQITDGSYYVPFYTLS